MQLNILVRLFYQLAGQYTVLFAKGNFRKLSLSPSFVTEDMHHTGIFNT